MTFFNRPSSFSELYCRMVSIDSCLALSIKPQVLITTISFACILPASCTTCMAFPRSCPISTSLSCMFFEQPSVTTFTRGLRGATDGFTCFVFMVCVSSLKQRIHKLLLVEQLEVVHFFAYPDVFHGYFELIGDADDHTALGSTVEFGEGQRV